MPKSNPERIIDRPYDTTLRRTTGVSGSGTSGTDLTALLRDGSRSLQGNLAVDTGITIDGVDIGAHKALYDAHIIDPSAHHDPVTAGDGIDLTGQAVAVDVTDLIDTDYGLTESTNNIRVNLASDPGLEFSSGALRVKMPSPSGLTRDSTGLHLSEDIDGDGLTLTAKVLAVGVANTGATGLTVEADAVRLTSSDNPGAAASILATGATGSLQLDTNLVYVDAPNNRVGINRTPVSGALDVLASANADHTLRIAQKSGQTGRLWRVESSGGQELIVLDSVGNLQSGNPGFVSGLTGWQISHTGTAEFNNVWVRGELHASIFVMDEFHATGGTLFVATAGKLENDAVIDSTPGTDYLEVRVSGVDTVVEIKVDSVDTALEVGGIFNYLDITDPPSGAAILFPEGITLRCKTFNGTSVYDLWFTVHGRARIDSSYYRYRVTKQSGTDSTIPAGTAIVSYGEEGDGRILLTSDLNYAPYMDVFTVGPNPWSGLSGAIIPHVRVGRLDGVGVTGVSGVTQYGLIAGTDLSDANSAHVVMSDTQVKLFKVNLTSNDGSNDTVGIEASGRFRLGTNIGTAATTGLDFDPSTGVLNIGNASYPAAVNIRGNITVTGGDAATQTYAGAVATSAAASALDDAEDYADAAQVLAQTYANTRRITGSTIAYTSTGQRALSWAAGSLRFGDGNSKTVSAGSYSWSTTQFAYLYVDITASAPLTMSGTNDITTLTTNHVLVAALEASATSTASGGRATIVSIGSATRITGDSIVTGTIVAANIAANTITASQIAAGTITSNEITVSNLQALNTNTGNLTVTGTLELGSLGAVASAGKTWANGVAGYWFGYTGAAHGMYIGDANSNMIWGGTALSLKLSSALQLHKSDADFNFLDIQNGSGTIRFYSVGGNGVELDNNFAARSGGTNDLLKWRNIGTAAAKLTTLYVTTIGDSSTGRATNVYSTNVDATTVEASSILTKTGGTVQGDYVTALLGFTNTVPGVFTGLATGWTTITLGTGFSSGTTTLAWAKAGEMVILKGSFSKGANFNTAIGTLPSGARPAATVEAPITAGPDAAWIRIETDGDIVLWGTAGGNAYDPIVINAVFTTLS